MASRWCARRITRMSRQNQPGCQADQAFFRAIGAVAKGIEGYEPGGCFFDVNA
jgi:hypothetical protein